MATRSAAKKAEERRISQIGDFKARMGGIHELPSGLVVKLRNPGGMKAFLGDNTIPNGLMVIIRKSLKSGQKPDAAELMGEEGDIDPQMLSDMTDLMNVVAMRCIVEPKIHPIPETEEDRSDELLYVDELPEDDKAFIFQWVNGGTRDLAEFRKRQQEDVDAVVASSSSVRDAQLRAGLDPR